MKIDENIFHYKKLYGFSNSAVLIIEADGDGSPRCFSYVTEKACQVLGYSEEELLMTKPLDICGIGSYIEESVEECKRIIENLSVNKICPTKENADENMILYLRSDAFEAYVNTKDNHRIRAALDIKVFRFNKKIIYHCNLKTIDKPNDLEIDIIEHSRLLQDVLKAIPDVVGVYRLDGEVMFYNKAGYDFFNKSFEKVQGKKCYEMFGRNRRCPNCQCEQAIKEKRILRVEKYIPEIDKYIDFSYNPVMNDLGDVVFVVEQLRDITEQKKLEQELRESELRYRQIVDLSPEAIAILQDDKVAFINGQAGRLGCASLDGIIGKSIYSLLPQHENRLRKRIPQILNEKKAKVISDYKITIDNKPVEVEVSSGFLMYNGKPAVQSVIRDITERKRELNAAAKLQKRILRDTFPLPQKAYVKALYVPAKTVSGDFYLFHKINDNLVIGIIIDVSGKGISAALNLSAFNVLFHEAALISQNPLEIINNLNKKTIHYLGEKYIAACCFSFDFEKHEARIVGAGINQFFIHCKSAGFKEKIVKGPFLGMFEDSSFEQSIVTFQKGDRFYFYTDGLESEFSDEEMKKLIINTSEISDLTNFIDDFLNEKMIDIEGILDDCTLLAIEIN